MAYDPKDPADVKIVTDAVAAAEAALTEQHEAEITGLKDKNASLLTKIAKLRAGGEGADAGELERLEGELADTKAKLRVAEAAQRTATRSIETLTGERDTARTEAETERSFANNKIVTGDLTGALLEANVAPHFLEDVTASLSGKATVKEVNGERKAFVGDKPLGEFVKEWAASDKGKVYILAKQNGGGGAQPPGGPSGGAPKKIAQMNTLERVAHHKAIGEEAFNAQLASEKA